jgi:hypothetical protein
MAQCILRRVGFSHLLVHEIGQNFGYPFRQVRPIMPPALDRHFGNAKEPCRPRIAAKDHLEEGIVLAAG